MDHKRTVSNYFLIVSFLIVLASAFIQDIFKVLPPMPNMENRSLSDKPLLELSQLNTFPTKYESYYNDHFAFRNQFVKLFAYVNLNVFGKCPYPDQVVIGRRNELFLVVRELDTYLRRNLFSKSELNKIRSDFGYRKKYLKAKGIEYYVAVIPTKYSVYPELLPWYIKPIDTISRTDQFINLMHEMDIQVIDIKHAMLKAKDSIPEQLYKKTDNHWNELGGFIASKEIIKEISKKFVSVKSLQSANYTISHQEVGGGNLAGILNMADVMKDDVYIFTPQFESNSHSIAKCPFPIPDNFEKENYFHGYYMDNPALPKVLIFHDSFGNGIMPFFKDSFSRTVFIWDKWQYKLNEPIVEAENPDIYITLTLESLLQGLMENCEYK
jgi:hypothetical protein